MKNVTITENSDYFIVKFDYEPRLVLVVKEIPDGTWDKSNKCWKIPVSVFHANKLIDRLVPEGFQIHPRIFNIAQRATKRRFTLKRDGLYDFQSLAVDFLNEMNGRALIADEQGLGKTIESLYWISQKDDINRILVVCPASVVFKWEAEIKKWDRKRTVSVVSKTKDELPDTNYIVMSYTIMTRKITELCQSEWDCFIADECHRCKSTTAQRSRAARNIESKYFLALSGTPVLNRPAEFFNILNMINPTHFGSWWSYVHRYCGARQTYWGLDTSGASNLDELNEKLAMVMIRRLKKDVLQELPDLTRTRIPIVVDGAEVNTAYRNLYRYIVENGWRGDSRAEALVRLNVLRQAIGQAKIASVLEIAEDVLSANPDRKIVIYAVHKKVVATLAEQLKQYGVATITGDVKSEDRSAYQKAFQERHIPRVMIISSAGGEGIDLYRASTIIFAEREWGPAPEEQAEARCHRIGQKNAVEAVYPIARDTLDEDIDTLIETKRAVLKQMMAYTDVPLNIESDLFESISKKGRMW